MICMVQGCETGDWDAVEGGLKAIGGGLQSIEEGIEARISWGGITAQFCRLIFLAIHIQVAQFNAPKNWERKCFWYSLQPSANFDPTDLSIVHFIHIDYWRTLIYFFCRKFVMTRRSGNEYWTHWCVYISWVINCCGMLYAAIIFLTTTVYRLLSVRVIKIEGWAKRNHGRSYWKYFNNVSYRRRLLVSLRLHQNCKRERTRLVNMLRLRGQVLLMLWVFVVIAPSYGLDYWWYWLVQIMWSGCKDSQISVDTPEAGQATGAMSSTFTTCWVRAYHLLHSLSHRWYSCFSSSVD